MKFLWRALVAGISQPMYLVAQNMQSAHGTASNNPQVQAEDVLNIQRIQEWDDQHNRTVVHWPEPPPPPDPDPDPGP